MALCLGDYVMQTLAPGPLGYSLILDHREHTTLTLQRVEARLEGSESWRIAG